MDSENNSKIEVRLDKWLHAARFYKTRSLATQMVEGGKVTYNGKRVKPSKLVEVGATITLTFGLDKKTIIVQELSNKRVAYKIAKNFYEETEESIRTREEVAKTRTFEQKLFTPGKFVHNKKDRRDLMRFKKQKRSDSNY